MKTKYLIFLVCLILCLLPIVILGQTTPSADDSNKLLQFLKGDGAFEQWFFKSFNRLDTSISAEASKVSFLGRLIGGIGATFYLSYMGWQMQSGDREWEITPMLKPFFIGLILLHWTSFYSFVQSPFRVVSTPSQTMFEKIEREANTLRVKRFQKQNQLLDYMIKKEAEEKAKILEAQEKANAARIDSEAQDEEITAKLAGTFVSYSFDVKREVTVNKKIHSFKSANWSDTGDVIEAGTKLKVDKLVSPAGYMMYRISSGEHSGKYITANEKFVSIDKKEDQLSNPISRPVAIKLLASQNIYSDEELSKVRVTMSNGAVLNINGYGISKNNRLIYYISDGSYVPVNPVRITEVNRESANSKDINKENNNSSNNQKNSTTQNTTQKKNN